MLVPVLAGHSGQPSARAIEACPDRAAFARQDSTTRSDITKVLDEQTAAWNRGDLDTLSWMATGDRPGSSSMSGGTRHDGFDAMRDRYRKRYQADGRAMGQLAFSGLEVEPLAPDSPRSSGGDSP